MKPVARLEVYRGFVFASLSPTGPGLKDWLGTAIDGIDDMCNRAPEGEVEVVPTCFSHAPEVELENLPGKPVGRGASLHHPYFDRTGRAKVEKEMERRPASRRPFPITTYRPSPWNWINGAPWTWSATPTAIACCKVIWVCARPIPIPWNMKRSCGTLWRGEDRGNP